MVTYNGYHIGLLIVGRVEGEKGDGKSKANT